MNKYSIPILVLVLSLLQIRMVSAQEDVNLAELPSQLAARLTIPLFAAQILTTAIFLAIFLFPTLLLTRNLMVHLVMGIVVLGFCIAMTWLPWWLLFVLCMLIALLFSGSVRNWLTGRAGD